MWILSGSVLPIRRAIEPLRAAILSGFTPQWLGMVRDAELRRLVIITEDTSWQRPLPLKEMYKGVLPGAWCTFRWRTLSMMERTGQECTWPFVAWDNFSLFTPLFWVVNVRDTKVVAQRLAVRARSILAKCWHPTLIWKSCDWKGSWASPVALDYSPGQRRK